MHFSRRQFLGYAAACSVLPANTVEPAEFTYRPGLQLYSVGEALRRDFDGTLKALAAMGYRDVELADLYGKSAPEWKTALSAAGLTARSAHFDVPTLQYDFDRTLDFARDLGLAYMILAFPRASNGSCPTLAEWKWNAGFLNTIGFLTAKAGIKFGYHNHNIEFLGYGARGKQRTGWDEIIEDTDPKLVTLQLDCGWAAAAGLDPAAMLAKNPGRYGLLHIKDIPRGLKINTALKIETTAVGQGRLDWKKILTAARAAGVIGYFVEVEPATKSPLDALQRSLAHLSAL